jgi:hypothetical protein
LTNTTDQIKTLNTLVHHRLCVQASLQKIVHELECRQLIHDESKFRADEFDGFCMINATARQHKYSSQEYKDAIKREKPTLDLHFARNSHHPDHHADCANMGLFDLVEMVCDWYATWQVYESAKPADQRTPWLESMQVNHDRFTQFTDSQWFVINQVAAYLVR